MNTVDDSASKNAESRWRCLDCGHKTFELDENGVSEEAAYCPMCGGDNVELTAFRPHGGCQP